MSKKGFQEHYLKEISNKLTVVIKLLIEKDKTYQGAGALTFVELFEGTGLSDQKIAEISKKTAKTIRNTRSKMKKNKRPKKGKTNGK